MLDWFKDETHRAYVYRALLAVLAMAGLYGLIGDNDIAGWTAVVTALFGNGLATLHTSTSAPASTDEDTYSA